LRRVNALKGIALTIIELDENPTEEVLECIRTLKNVIEVCAVRLEEGEMI
jgi:L-serine dehydratase